MKAHDAIREYRLNHLEQLQDHYLAIRTPSMDEERWRVEVIVRECYVCGGSVEKDQCRGDSVHRDNLWVEETGHAGPYSVTHNVR